MTWTWFSARTGPEALCPGDRVQILADVLGREIRYEARPDDEARAELLAQMPKPYVDTFFSFYSDGKLDESTAFPTVGAGRSAAERWWPRSP